MAKNRNNNNPVASSEEPEMAEGAEERDEREEAQQQRPAGPRPAVRSAGGVNLFKAYKPTQGKRVRMITGISVGVLLLGAWDWIFRQLHTASFIGDREWLATAIALGFCAVVALITWYLVGVRPGSVDFLIATESEMKKVTWSSRKEIWGATKVVIGMVVLIAVGLFVVDLGFAWFFWKIGILKAPFGG